MEIDKSLFEPISAEDKDLNVIVRPSVTYLQDAWDRLKKNKLAMGGLIVVLIIVLMAVFGPMISHYNYYKNDLANSGQWPTAKHWFGTDQFGRDIFTRNLYGARISLTIGFVVSLINLFIGILYGGISGYIGGTVDNIMMRIVEIIYAVPFTIYVILIMIILGPGLKSIIIALTIGYWVDMARIVRGEVLQLKQREFVLAAKTLGARGRRILLKHLLPNSIGPILVTMTLTVPSAIFTEAFLSFIGLGIKLPQASWGTLCSDALNGLTYYPYQLVFPALSISITMLAFNFLGDGIRDAFDPKMRK
ncbi:MAG TPA: ABC transporter permease [Clostridiaceae bacterium]